MGYYHHQSATMACLQQLIQDPKKTSFTLDEIRQSIAADNNSDRKKSHRLRFFDEKSPEILSGTDHVMKSIQTYFS